jgi:hypothetical protein
MESAESFGSLVCGGTVRTYINYHAFRLFLFLCTRLFVCVLSIIRSANGNTS